ncbi:nuclease [Rhynchospora pubera]|uniref:Nuclease n=1 Tax=Rhynchospora pubera TaxID=906938 RepID=A0AAV8CS70_9POAL|nr:nuclease [Rhynchospora pubera]
MSFFFHRGRATISHDFHRVINAIIELEATYFKQPDGSTTPSEITNSSRFYPYFKDCIGAIDGTHFRVKVNSKEAPKYRGRKDIPTMNVLAACTPNLKFTYVLVGWPGMASDSKILKNALRRRYPLNIPQGKFYLVDAGFMIKSGLITPYRGERYHLKEFSSNPPQNDRELFNLRHSSLRNSIERAFGVLKKRFPIIASGAEPHYDKDTQNLIILACCILHNFLLDVDPDNENLTEVDRELANRRPVAVQPTNDLDEDENDRVLGQIIRDRIANEMWNDYILAHGCNFQ